MNGEIILRMKNISKAFPGVQALKDVNFDLKKGEVHAIVGENGAGKSTLMKVLGGLYLAEEGEIEINGAPVKIGNPRDALDHQISIIHQEHLFIELADFCLCPLDLRLQLFEVSLCLIGGNSHFRHFLWLNIRDALFQLVNLVTDALRLCRYNNLQFLNCHAASPPSDG